MSKDGNSFYRGLKRKTGAKESVGDKGSLPITSNDNSVKSGGFYALAIVERRSL